MLFGLTNIPGNFQGYINKIFAEKLNIFIIIYSNDILIYIDDVISGHRTYKSRVYVILVINDLTLVSLLPLISLFDQPFLTGIPSSCPALLTCPHPIIRIDFTRFCPHFSKSYDGCVTLRATYKSAPS